MKILLISPIAPPAGGIATWTKEYLESEYAEENEIKLVNIAVSGKRIREGWRFNFFEELHRLRIILKNLKLVLKKDSFDIVHINSSCSRFGLIRELICINMIKKRKIDIVIHFHCDVSYMIKRKIQKIILKKILKQVNKIIVLNKISLEYIKNISSKSKIYIIPNFIDSGIVDTTNKDISNEVKKVVFVGRVSELKGCNNIIDVAYKFPQIEFTLIGKVENSYINKKIPDNVKMIGEVNNVIDQIKMADVFLFPTHTEGFPCALLEAMAVGLPIIATRVGAIPDMLEEKGGLYCKINNNEDIISSIQKLQYDKELRTRMSEWNRNKVKSNYLKEDVLKKIFSIYG